MNIRYFNISKNNIPRFTNRSIGKVVRLFNAGDESLLEDMAEVERLVSSLKDAPSTSISLLSPSNNSYHDRRVVSPVLIISVSGDYKVKKKGCHLALRKGDVSNGQDGPHPTTGAPPVGPEEGDVAATHNAILDLVGGGPPIEGGPPVEVGPSEGCPPV